MKISIKTKDMIEVSTGDIFKQIIDVDALTVEYLDKQYLHSNDCCHLIIHPYCKILAVKDIPDYPEGHFSLKVGSLYSKDHFNLILERLRACALNLKRYTRLNRHVPSPNDIEEHLI